MDEQERRMVESAEKEEKSAALIEKLEEKVKSNCELKERFNELQKKYIELDSRNLDSSETSAALKSQLNELQKAHETALKELAARASKEEQSSDEEDEEDLRITKVHNEATIKSLEAKLEVLQSEQRPASAKANSTSSASERENEKELTEALRKVDDLSIEVKNNIIF